MGFSFLKGEDESRIAKEEFVNRNYRGAAERRYGKAFMVMITLLLIILWGMQ